MKRILILVAMLVASIAGSMHAVSAEEDVPCLLDVGYPEVCRMFASAEQERLYGVSVTVIDMNSPGMSHRVIDALVDGAAEDNMTASKMEGLPEGVNHTTIEDSTDPDQIVKIIGIAHENYVIVLITVSTEPVEDEEIVELYNVTAEKVDAADALGWDVLPTAEELPMDGMRETVEGSLMLDESGTPEAATPEQGTPEAAGTPE